MINQCSDCGGFCKKSGCERENVKLTPQRTWVGLTNGEMIELSEMKLGSWDLILEVEDKLRSKNSE